LVTSLVVLLIPVSGPAEDMVSALQAEYIERFPQFIEWPADSSVSDTSAPFVIGVYGSSDIFEALERIASRTQIKGKTVEVRKITSLGAISSCQILFISTSERDQLSAILSQARRKPILTISAAPGFARRGVAINFTLEGSALRFEINESAATDNGLRLSPNLLALGNPI
jgi:hypothetical protein